jgi:RNA polymerase sigma factor (sigma-70 family)
LSAGPTAHVSEPELIEALGRGEPQAVAALYRLHGPRMVAFAERYVGDRGSAEDVVVGLVGRWLEHPPGAKEIKRMDAFLATSVYHAAVDWIRRDRAQQGRPPRTSSESEPGADLRLAGPIADPGSSPSLQDLRDRLAAALQRMSPEERLLLETHYGHALTADECIADLRITRAAFHQRLHRARSRLARLLAEEG